MKLQDYMDKKPVLETGQLILRPLQVSDVADLKEWMGAPSLYQYWGKRPGKGDLNPELLFQKKRNQQKAFTGVSSIKKTIKWWGRCGSISLKRTVWQKWHSACPRLIREKALWQRRWQKWWSSVLRKRNCKGSGRMSTFRILRHIKHWKRPDSAGGPYP